jgi:hypothetical protein
MRLLTVAFTLVAVLTGSAQAQQVVVQPQETDEILANPGMGWETFHRTSKHDKNLPSWIPSTVGYARWGWGEPLAAGRCPSGGDRDAGGGLPGWRRPRGLGFAAFQMVASQTPTRYNPAFSNSPNSSPPLDKCDCRGCYYSMTGYLSHCQPTRSSSRNHLGTAYHLWPLGTSRRAGRKAVDLELDIGINYHRVIICDTKKLPPGSKSSRKYAARRDFR